MGMAWCRASGLTAEVARTLKGEKFPLRRQAALAKMMGKEADGVDVHLILGKALRRREYTDLRAVMRDLEDWLAAQG